MTFDTDFSTENKLSLPVISPPSLTGHRDDKKTCWAAVLQLLLSLCKVNLWPYLLPLYSLVYRPGKVKPCGLKFAYLFFETYENQKPILLCRKTWKLFPSMSLSFYIWCLSLLMKLLFGSGTQFLPFRAMSLSSLLFQSWFKHLVSMCLYVL